MYYLSYLAALECISPVFLFLFCPYIPCLYLVDEHISSSSSSLCTCTFVAAWKLIYFHLESVQGRCFNNKDNFLSLLFTILFYFILKVYYKFGLFSSYCPDPLGPESWEAVRRVFVCCGTCWLTSLIRLICNRIKVRTRRKRIGTSSTIYTVGTTKL